LLIKNYIVPRIKTFAARKKNVTVLRKNILASENISVSMSASFGGKKYGEKNVYFLELRFYFSHFSKVSLI